MNYLAQVQRGIDFIEDHLDSEVAMGDVARIAGISQWHFQRIFKALTNETLKGYIRSRRLANAFDKLIASEARVIEIALEAGFDSQEAFTRAFKDAFGVTPAAHRKRGRRPGVFSKVRIDADYLRQIHRNVSLEPEIFEAPEMHLIGMSTRIFGVESEKNNLGKKLPGLWSSFLPRIGEIEHTVAGTCYGVIRQAEEQGDELEYSAVIGVTRTERIPDGMVSVHLPATRYAKFAHVGDVANVDRTVNYVYSTWLAQSGFRHTYAPDLEIYGVEYQPCSEHSVMNYAIPVEQG